MTAFKVQLDSLVRGVAGTTYRQVEGRVYRTGPNGSVAIIGKDDGKQWIIYEPEVIDAPRRVADRRDIPDRLR